MEYVYELVYLGNKTIGIYSSEAKAIEAQALNYEFRLYVCDSIEDYTIRKTILE